MSAAGKNPRQGILSLTIRDKSSLYAAYYAVHQKRRPVYSDQ